MKYLKQLYFYLTHKSNYEEVKHLIVSGETRVSAIPWWSVRYEGVTYPFGGSKHCLACEGTDGIPVMGIPLEKMYNIKIVK